MVSTPLFHHLLPCTSQDKSNDQVGIVQSHLCVGFPTEVRVEYPSQAMKTFMILCSPVSLASFEALLNALLIILYSSSLNATSWHVSRTFCKRPKPLTPSLLSFLMPPHPFGFSLNVIISKNLTHQHCSRCICPMILHARALFVPFGTWQLISMLAICSYTGFGVHHPWEISSAEVWTVIRQLLQSQSWKKVIGSEMDAKSSSWQ